MLRSCIDDQCPRFTPTGVDITHLLTPWDWDVTMADIVFLLVEVRHIIGTSCRESACLALIKPSWPGEISRTVA